jgi:hypothetical protein
MLGHSLPAPFETKQVTRDQEANEASMSHFLVVAAPPMP